jgi:hypothetical protein
MIDQDIISLAQNPKMQATAHPGTNGARFNPDDEDDHAYT